MIAEEKRTPDAASFFDIGGDEGDRTPDLMNAIHALSQLSYVPELENGISLSKSRIENITIRCG